MDSAGDRSILAHEHELVSQVADGRQRTALHPSWTVNPLLQDRCDPMDENATAMLNERRVVVALTQAATASQGLFALSRNNDP